MEKAKRGKAYTGSDFEYDLRWGSEEGSELRCGTRDRQYRFPLFAFITCDGLEVGNAGGDEVCETTSLDDVERVSSVGTGPSHGWR